MAILAVTEAQKIKSRIVDATSERKPLRPFTCTSPDTHDAAKRYNFKKWGQIFNCCNFTVRMYITATIAMFLSVEWVENDMFYFRSGKYCPVRQCGQKRSLRNIIFYRTVCCLLVTALCIHSKLQIHFRIRDSLSS
jgi:hypothetical protein